MVKGKMKLIPGPAYKSKPPASSTSHPTTPISHLPSSWGWQRALLMPSSSLSLSFVFFSSSSSSSLSTGGPLSSRSLRRRLRLRLLRLFRLGLLWLLLRRRQGLRRRRRRLLLLGLRRRSSGGRVGGRDVVEGLDLGPRSGGHRSAEHALLRTLRLLKRSSATKSQEVV